MDQRAEIENGQRVPKVQVTVVVPIRNEERNLARCLERLSRFQKVIVVDSQSTDKSLEIAHKYGAHVMQFTWNGKYPKKRNWVLLHGKFETDWVLFLDADELCNNEFCDEIAARILDTDAVGFWITFTNTFLGRQLKFGVPQRKLSLFRPTAGLYERIEEDRWSDLDMEVHEHPVLSGRIDYIRTRIEHADLNGLEKFIDRHKNYAVWETFRYRSLQTGKNISALTPRQRRKYSYVKRWWFAWLYFFFTYIVRLGFLDGPQGFYYAFYKSWYFLTVRQMLIEQDVMVREEK